MLLSQVLHWSRKILRKRLHAGLWRDSSKMCGFCIDSYTYKYTYGMYTKGHSYAIISTLYQYTPHVYTYSQINVRIHVSMQSLRRQYMLQYVMKCNDHKTWMLKWMHMKGCYKYANSLCSVWGASSWIAIRSVCLSVCLSVVQCVSLLLLVQVPSSALNTATHRPKAHLLRTEELSELRFV